MKLSIRAYDKQREKSFSYTLKVPDYVLVTGVVLLTGVVMTCAYMRRGV